MSDEKDRIEKIRSWLSGDELKTTILFMALGLFSLAADEPAWALAFFFVMNAYLATSMLFRDHEEEARSLGRPIEGFWARLFIRASRDSKDDEK